MRIALFLLLLAAGWVFMVENDQELVNITLPGSGRIGPFSIGIVILGSVLFGIILCSLTGGVLRLSSKIRKGRSGGGGSSASSPHDDLH